MFEMLSDNRASVKSYARQNNGNNPRIFLRQSFQEANKMFRVIDSIRGVIVPYDEVAKDIISDLCSDRMMLDRVNLLRKAQKYTVNTFKFESLQSRGLIREVAKDSGIHYLVDGNYDYKYGLREGSKLETLLCGE
jgi:hypothetical protein